MIAVDALRPVRDEDVGLLRPDDVGDLVGCFLAVGQETVGVVENPELRADIGGELFALSDFLHPVLVRTESRVAPLAVGAGQDDGSVTVEDHFSEGWPRRQIHVSDVPADGEDGSAHVLLRFFCELPVPGHFMPLSTTPRTEYFWKKRKISSTGTVLITIPAMPIGIVRVGAMKLCSNKMTTRGGIRAGVG